MNIINIITHNINIITFLGGLFMASKEQLRKIEIYCDSYAPKNSDGIKSQTGNEPFESCENCKHFTKEGKCDIDLIDKVLSSLAMENDLKS